MPVTGKDISEDVKALLRARNPLIWINSREEARVEGFLFEAAKTAEFAVYTWDVGQGVADMAGAVQPIGGTDPGATLTAIQEQAQRGDTRRVWIMRDLPPWLVGNIGMTTCRQLRNLVRMLPGTPRDRAQAIIILAPTADVPPELANHATVIEFPLPDRKEIGDILDGMLKRLPDEMKAGAVNGAREVAIDAAVGLSGEEVEACYARSLVQLRKIDPALISKEKKRVIARERVLEWFDPLPGGLDAVGGLDVLKAFLVSRKAAYSPAARAYGLPAPKGILLCGVPGTGKSYTAKAVATAWGVPLLKLDLGSLKSKFVGESESNLRRAFKTIEAIGRCVVLVDEIEKALAGATQGAADGGVSADALGTLLSWMQDRQGEAFIVATANKIDSLPPELMRKGRFDQIFWLDLPNAIERAEIVRTSLVAHSRPDISINPEKIASVTEGFTGAEIAALVPDALFTAFADNQREIIDDDLIAAARSIVPLSKTMADKIEVLRTWAVGRAIPASSPATAVPARNAGSRQIDL